VSVGRHLEVLAVEVAKDPLEIVMIVQEMIAIVMVDRFNQSLFIRIDLILIPDRDPLGIVSGHLPVLRWTGIP
jgi:hypothetical protein